MPALGDEFRAAREARGLSLSDVAEQIHIRSVYLAQIERENWSAIGAPVYVRGFLRTYARFLGLDPEQAVGQFNESSVETSATQSPLPAVARDAAPRGASPVLWVAGAVAAVLVGFVIYNSYTLSRGPTALVRHRTSAFGSTPPSRVHHRAKPARTARVAQTLAIHLTALSWLRIVIDGNVTMEGTFPAGTAKSFHGKRAEVRVGNAGGVDLTVNGKHVGKLGAIGAVAERTIALQE